MKDSTPDTTQVPCHGCNRPMIVPAGPVRSAMREERTYVVFCSRRCNLTYIAQEGTKQQEESNARRSDASELGGPAPRPD